MQSELIDSTLRMFIPEITAILIPKETEEGNIDTYDIINGKQRLTTIVSFLADEWKLTELKPVTIDGEKFDISGLKFSELPELVRNEIKAFILDFTVVITNEGDDREKIIEDLFIRLNKWEEDVKLKLV